MYLLLQWINIIQRLGAEKDSINTFSSAAVHTLKAS